MYNINRQPIHKVKSKIYIASWTGNTIDDYGNLINQYEEPKPYMFNVQTLNESISMQTFGREVIASKVISITEKDKYLDKFKEYDLVYVNKTPTKFEPTPTPSSTPIVEEASELEYGDDADYFISGVRNQNTSIRIYLTKLQNEQK
jgi:hypothetical protein